MPNGKTFLIDAEDIKKVESEYWHEDKAGYVISKKANLRLHRFLLGVTDSNIIVDHINRNRLDNRKRNLCIVSPFQNSANHSRLSSNKTGFVGVYYSNHNGKYEVKVGYGRQRIRLGSSKDDMIRLAQMYNVAAQYLFGDYVGELNPVPDPPQELVDQVIAKCQKYIKAPAQAGTFSMREVAI